MPWMVLGDSILGPHLSEFGIRFDPYLRFREVADTGFKFS
jgi:hypothetical protein